MAYQPQLLLHKINNIIGIPAPSVLNRPATEHKPDSREPPNIIPQIQDPLVASIDRPDLNHRFVGCEFSGDVLVGPSEVLAVSTPTSIVLEEPVPCVDLFVGLGVEVHDGGVAVVEREDQGEEDAQGQEFGGPHG